MMRFSPSRRGFFWGVVGLLLCLSFRLWAADPAAVFGRDGAVATAAPEATEAGLKMLSLGGNAADAAVAAALVLAVVHPQAGNLGGGGFAVLRFGTKTAALDFREIAPAGASPSLFLDAEGKPIPERSLVGPLAAGVPGSPAGLYELHHRYGVLPWPRVVRPAIRLARDGFSVSTRLARAIRRHRKLLERFPATAAVWLPGGRAPNPGDRMALPDLAATLEAYAARGPAALNSGPIAAAVEVTSRSHGGVLRAADLKAYQPLWRQPIHFQAWGWDVVSMPLPSSGGLILACVAGIAQRVGYDKAPPGGALRAHLLLEAFRRAYADRSILGDPTSTEADAAQLLAPAWLDRRAQSIERTRATPSADVRPWPGAAPPPEHTETTHLSVLDGRGNAVSMTTTLNGSFGCGVLVPGVGFLLNNEMDDFSMAPGHPNLYGLIQGRANAVAPGRRMLSSMSPSIAWRKDRILVLGSPGGSRIPTTVLQVLFGVIVDHLDLQAAVDRPRIHHQWLPDRAEAEVGALSPETLAALQAMGHNVRLVRSMGEAHAVLRLPGGFVEAAADPRGPGAAGVLRKVPRPMKVTP